VGLANDGHKFANKMVIYTNGDSKLAAEIQKVLHTPEISVDDRKISRLSKGNDLKILLEFEDGDIKTEGFLVHRPRITLKRELADQLGLEYGPTGDIKTSMPFNETSLAGVFAVGDCASPMKSIPNAINMGAYAGAGLARALPRFVTGNNFQ
jgi:thioredoxin reductase